MNTALVASLAALMLPGIAGIAPNSQAAPALFATKAEAEQAAQKLNCTGAHQMGEQWMPCASHAEVRSSRRHDALPLYPTKAEAEQAAQKLNCTGAHQMGEQWMPCASHPEPK